jgi:hypothetical protein
MAGEEKFSRLGATAADLHLAWQDRSVFPGLAGSSRQSHFMDASATLNNVVSHVVRALAEYADSKGWDRQDFRIYYYMNEEWGVVNFVFVAKAFDDEDNSLSYLDVWNFLIKHFASAPEILRLFSLVVRGMEQVKQGGLYGIGSSYRLVEPELVEFWMLHPASR